MKLAFLRWVRARVCVRVCVRARAMFTHFRQVISKFSPTMDSHNDVLPSCDSSILKFALTCEWLPLDPIGAMSY